MDVSIPFWLLVIVGIAVILALVFAFTRRRVAPLSPEPPPAPPRPVPASELARELDQLQLAGRRDEIPRLLDRRLPEWTVSSSLIEVSRALGLLEGELATVPATPVTEVVTTRLAEQTRTVREDLWRLAGRIDVAARRGTRLDREALEREDAALVQLLAAINATRSEVADLALGTAQGSTIERAEGRFRALAATARELHELEREANIRSG